jgi:hypothetical protein
LPSILDGLQVMKCAMHGTASIPRTLLEPSRVERLAKHVYVIFNTTFIVHGMPSLVTEVFSTGHLQLYSLDNILQRGSRSLCVLTHLLPQEFFEFRFQLILHDSNISL